MPLPAVALTRERLWFLYCLADFSYREITEDVTGWKHAEIKNAIRKWDLDRWHETYFNARGLVRAVALQALIARREEPFPRELIDTTERDATVVLQRFVTSGELSWEQIDSLMASLDRRGLLELLAGAVDQAVSEAPAPN